MSIEKFLDLLDKIDGYPYDPAKDHPFLTELLAEFPNVDLNEELIRFRLWLSECPPYPRLRYRLLLRKWIQNASKNN
jgi:hypothetical protein